MARNITDWQPGPARDGLWTLSEQHRPTDTDSAQGSKGNGTLRFPWLKEKVFKTLFLKNRRKRRKSTDEGRDVKEWLGEAGAHQPLGHSGRAGVPTDSQNHVTSFDPSSKHEPTPPSWPRRAL